VDQPDSGTRSGSGAKPAPKPINDREFSIVVPKRDNAGNPIKPAVIEEFAHRIAQRFGGITVHPMVAGCFIPDEGEHEGELMCEENAIISTVRDSEDGVPKPLDEQYIERTAQDVAEQLGQISVMTTEDKTEVEFVQGDYVGELPDDMVGENVFRSLL